MGRSWVTREVAGAQGGQTRPGGLTSLHSRAPNSEPPSRRPGGGVAAVPDRHAPRQRRDARGSDSGPPSSPRRPSPVRRHLQALDKLAQENIRALYKFNVSGSGQSPATEDAGPGPAFPLDRSVRLQRLSHPGGRDRVGFRLVSGPGGRPARGPGRAGRAPR